MAEKPSTSPLRPSSLHVKESNGTEHTFGADNHFDLMWLYYHFKSQKGQYREVTLYDCTGHKLKVRLRVDVELVGELVKEEIVYATPLAEHMHADKFIDT